MVDIQLPKLPDPLEIRNLVENSKEPLVFNGFTRRWDMLSWTLEKWGEILGESKLPFRSNLRESNQQPQWEGLCQTIHLTMQDFIQNCKLGSCSSKEWFYFDYKHMAEWFFDNPETLEAVTWESFGFPERTGKDSTLWIGSKGAHTPCHLDTYGYNLVAQVYGRKQWILFPPEATASMLPTRVPYEESSIYSSRNFNYPDAKMAQDLQGAHVITLNPGDVLFVPHHWWHYVENVDTAISINTWIPLKADNGNRVNESLVRLFISQICKDLPNLNFILNPNEVDLIDYPLSISMHHIQHSLEQVIETPETEEFAAKKPKLMLEEIHAYSTSPENKIPDVIKIYVDNIKSVPKCTYAEFEELLEKKRKELERISVGLSKSLPLDSKDALLHRVINSFCHPDVISLVKEKLKIDNTRMMHPQGGIVSASTSSDSNKS